MDFVESIRALREDCGDIRPSRQPIDSSRLLASHIGQSGFKTLAEIHLENARKGGTFPHVILYGGAGLGKTTLAKLLAKCLGGRFRFYIGEDLKPNRIHELVQGIEENDVVFIDEIHSIHPGGAEILYDVAQDFLYMGEPVPEFVMIGATTDAGDVPKPLFDRFQWSYLMEPYTLDELTQIVQMHFPELEDEVAKECAKRGLDTPRIARNLAFHVAAAQGTLPAEEVFRLRGVDELGFTRDHRMVLRVLDESNRPVGFQELQYRTNIPKSDLSSFCEPQLIRAGFLSRSMKGRVITPEGVNYLRGREADEHNDDEGPRARN